MKIGLCGTMSVGKTTLVNELKKLGQFKDFEFATERSEYLMNLGIPLNTDSTLNGQTIFLAERVAELMKENIVTDRTIIDVIAFTNLSKSIDFICMHWTALNQRNITYLQNKSLKVFSYTAKDYYILNYMKKYSLDGIISNFIF